MKQVRFPPLPLVDKLVDAALATLSTKPLEGVVLVGVQHLLATTGSMLESLFRLGLKPSSTFLLGKFYSTNPGVAEKLAAAGVNISDSRPPARRGTFREDFQLQINELWRVVVGSRRPVSPQKLLILDDGGQCVEGVPIADLGRTYVGAVEQTTSGARSVKVAPFPVVQVATSAIKRIFEPPMIASAVVDKLPREVLATHNRKTPIGIVGMGYIGTAVAQALKALGFRVQTYDKATVQFGIDRDACASIDDLLDCTDTIFGCTGEDILSGVSIARRNSRPLTLVSCSSGDMEFRSILLQLPGMPRLDAPAALETVEGIVQGRVVRVYRGGYPVNFDRAQNSVPPRSIQLTRSLLVAALLQVAEQSAEAQGEIMLDPAVQRVLLAYWAEVQGSSSNTEFSRAEIACRSGGKMIPFDSLAHLEAEILGPIEPS